MRKAIATTVGAIAAVAALTACNPLSDKSARTVDTQPAGNAAPAAEPAAQSSERPGDPYADRSGGNSDENSGEQQQKKVLKVSKVDGLSPIVTSAAGRTVYRFDEDSANPSKTTCLGECAKTWEPVLAGSGVEVQGGGIDVAKLGTIQRPEGSQVTLKGWPLYYYKDDKKLGEISGHGRGDVWFAVNPKGGKAKAEGEQPQPPSQQPAKKDVQVLTVNVVDGFMPFVTNEKGRTVYRFDNDSTKPPTTTCFGECAKIWEPVLAGKKGFAIKGNKIDKSKVGTIDRPEGKQLTLNGWPLYYFHKDKELGQTAGYGVNGVWFAIAPDGKKAALCP
jgi:predicted lipoprotein with Yx(FWY)xxD motif